MIVNSINSSSKILLCFILYSLVTTSCSNKAVNEDKNAIKLTTLNVEQLDKNGDIQFIFKTKDVRIAEINNKAKAFKSNLLIYHNNLPYYNLFSNEASIFNSGEIINLSNGLVMSSLLNKNFQLQAKSLTWDKLLAKAEISGLIKAKINNISFIAETANYDHNKNKITFDNINKLVYIDNFNLTNISSDANTAEWDGSTKKLSFSTDKKSVKSRFIIRKN